jgi:hypothetical protein
MKVQTEAWEKLKKARENAEKDVVDEEVSFFFCGNKGALSCLFKSMCLACPGRRHVRCVSWKRHADVRVRRRRWKTCSCACYQAPHTYCYAA